MPVWESFYAWLEQLNPVKRSKLEKAVIYAKKHKETLRNYLQDGRCEISNNAAERRAKMQKYATYGGIGILAAAAVLILSGKKKRKK